MIPQSGELWGGETLKSERALLQPPRDVSSSCPSPYQPVTRTVKPIVTYYPSPRVTMICLRCAEPIRQVGVEETSPRYCGCPHRNSTKHA